MSTEQIDRCDTNEQALLYAQTDLAQAQRIAAMWAAPVIVDSDIPECLKIPPSLWAEQKRQGDTPPLFLIGRRLFARTSDLRAWLDEKAAQGRPGSKSRRAEAAK